MGILNALPGNPFPYGATILDGGVNFAVYSKNATKVTLEFYDRQEDCVPCATVEFDSEKNRTGDIWHAFVPGIKKSALYLFRVDGPFEPEKGNRFNAKQKLFDPYAKAITPISVFYNLPPDYRAPLDKLDVDHEETQNNYLFPKCVVVDNSDFDWQGDRPINRRLSESIIYEVHLKGFTAGKNADVSNPGTYAGFVQKIPYLKDLGITAVELLPIFEFDEYENSNVNPRTGERMKNYWGYSTVNFFSPKASFAADKNPGGCVNEFKTLVRELHKAGIEIILDVVFNHTAEGNEHGVALNFRGFENSVYYTLVSSHKEYYMNYSGCGNTVNCNHPVVRDFILDCLRYWVLNYHVDGFRFDLASILTRSQEGIVLNFPPLTNAISEDPVLGRTKIIAEPWDAGGAYQLGGFPGGRWAEWNDRFRDDIRRFWRGDEHVSTDAATRISGSSDLFKISGRTPCHSINYISCHDGFTMNDLVSYNMKHNEENGEQNRDGTDSNWSYNHGFEGPTMNPAIEKMRNRQMRNFILTLMISQGTPMILGGDEFRRGQQGNNNAYCQDNDISWFDWTNCGMNANLVSFTKKAIALRKKYEVFRRREFFRGKTEGRESDIQWYAADGTNPDWTKISKFLAFKLCGRAILSDDEENSAYDFFVAANTDRQDIMIRIPPLKDARKWYRIADTSIEDDTSMLSVENAEKLFAQNKYVLPSSSMLVLVAK